jgi:hypothetical protein
MPVAFGWGSAPRVNFCPSAESGSMSRSRIPRARRNLSIHQVAIAVARASRRVSDTHARRALRARRARMEVAGCVRKHGEVAERLNVPVLRAGFFAAV